MAAFAIPPKLPKMVMMTPKFQIEYAKRGFRWRTILFLGALILLLHLLVGINTAN